jgi:hypothetical protein
MSELGELMAKVERVDPAALRSQTEKAEEKAEKGL